MASVSRFLSCPLTARRRHPIAVLHVKVLLLAFIIYGRDFNIGFTWCLTNELVGRDWLFELFAIGSFLFVYLFIIFRQKILLTPMRYNLQSQHRDYWSIWGYVCRCFPSIGFLYVSGELGPIVRWSTNTGQRKFAGERSWPPQRTQQVVRYSTFIWRPQQSAIVESHNYYSYSTINTISTNNFY